jgi:hypothetical protein
VQNKKARDFLFLYFIKLYYLEPCAWVAQGIDSNINTNNDGNSN